VCVCCVVVVVRLRKKPQCPPRQQQQTNNRNALRTLSNRNNNQQPSKKTKPKQKASPHSTRVCLVFFLSFVFRAVCLSRVPFFSPPFGLLLQGHRMTRSAFGFRFHALSQFSRRSHNRPFASSRSLTHFLSRDERICVGFCAAVSFCLLSLFSLLSRFLFAFVSLLCV
jgi:hypothetical protein